MKEPISADQVEIEPVDWLWNDRIPRKMITIIGGRRDNGKGLFVSYLAASVSKSIVTDPDTGLRRPGRVLYSAAEDSDSIMTAPRLVAAGANMTNVDLTRFRLPVDFDAFEAHLIRGVDLVVMDPLASHLSNGINRYSDNIRRVTDPLAELIEMTNTAVVVVDHITKRMPQSGVPLDAFGGTASGIVAAARMAFLLGVDPSDVDRRVLCCVKHNICEQPRAVDFEIDVIEVETAGDVPYLLLGAECDFDPKTFLEISKNHKLGRAPDKRAAACEWLTNHLYAARQQGKLKVKAGEVIEDGKQMGISDKTLRRARQDLEIVLDPPGGGRTCFWSLPDALVALMDEANNNSPSMPDSMDAQLSALLGGGEDGTE